jgi:hypothetical protein
MVLEGECNCGAIKVTINDSAEKTQPVYCRCLNCRKQSGARMPAESVGPAFAAADGL